MPENRPDIEAIFFAVQQKRPQDRAAYLDRVCGDDAALRRRVEQFLNAQKEIGSFLETPAVQRPAEEFAEQASPDGTQAESPSSANDSTSLEFLSPSEKPDSLGRLSHYEIFEVIGQGGMGIVLRAFDEKLHRVVAIKVMASALAATSPPRKRFLREARAAAAVRHEHVVDIHAVEEQPIPYLVMEYVPGETLQQKLDRIGPLETPEVLRVGRQIARGLAAAHAQGLIHRDIKPANILLEKGAEERVKITDFGLARAAADASMTQSGVIVGTPMYMAPEQTVGDTIDHRADLFSLGSVLYTMISGRPPFRATTSMATLKRVAEDTPRPIREIIPEVPEWLCDIIAKLHAKKPDERFQSAKEVADLLGQYLAHIEHPSVVQLPIGESGRADFSKPRLVVPTGASKTQPRPRTRRWAAAALLLCLLGGLSLTEATGVTRLRATVIRIFTPEGVLVVETDDPNVKVTIEGDGGLVIAGAGPQEVRLKAGSYKLQAAKDGKPVRLDQELITITRGGKEVVKVRLEGEAAEAKAATKEPGAFVLLSGKGVEVGKFDTLAEAVRRASDGDAIEIRGNGPFITDRLRPGSKSLTIRAGPGYAPIIEPSQVLVKDDVHYLNFVVTYGSLTLEGLDLRLPQDSKYQCLLLSSFAPLNLTNCKLVVHPDQRVLHASVSRAQIRNCLIVSSGACILLYSSPGMQLTVDNCLIAHPREEPGIYWQPGAENSPGTRFRLSRNTIVAKTVLEVGGPDDALADRLRDAAAKPVVPTIIETEENVCQLSGSVFVLFSVTPKSPQGLPVEEQRRAIPKLIQWRERGNVYGLEKEPFLNLKAPGLELVKDLTKWNDFWGLKDTGSLQGPVRLRGEPQGLLADTPQAITPNDFRLRPDSAGYQAGKDKKDLGADIDLVGPGPAYERWKKTPEYQQWLKDTGQLRAESPKAEPNAFVLLGGKGVEAEKYDTLAEAVKSASSGDTIEIRGNGPFITDPVRLDGIALTIRAGASYRPVIRLSPAAAEGAAPLLFTNAPLVLEGLDLERPRLETPAVFRAPVVWADHAPLFAANCRFRVSGVPWQVCVIAWSGRLAVRNCVFISPGSYSFGCFPDTDMDNCIHLGRHLCVVGGNYRFTRNTVVATSAETGQTAVQVQLVRTPAEAVKEPKTRVEAAGCVFAVRSAVLFTQEEAFVKKAGLLGPGEEEALLPQLLTWHDRGNLYGTGGASVSWGAIRTTLGKAADWKAYWGQADADISEGTVKFEGGNLVTRASTEADKITPDDFRLRPDSAGYQAGKNKKDLGADIDLVGPGKAYEKWKKTPEYQQWLKDTDQVKPKAEAKAFVLLRSRGVAEWKFDTLAEAIMVASAGDTIEVRGNGPFVTDPIPHMTQALTIRAGSGFRPIIRVSPKGAKGNAPLLDTNAPLVLEGLELQRLRQKPDQPWPLPTLVYALGPVRAANCRFLMTGASWQICVTSWANRLVLRNCEFICLNSTSVLNGTPLTRHLVLDNCLHLGSVNGIHYDGPPPEGYEVLMTRNTVMCPGNWIAMHYMRPPKEGGPAPRKISIEAAGSVFAAPLVLGFRQTPESIALSKRLEPGEQTALLPRLLAWRDRGNVYSTGGASIAWDGTHTPDKPADWKKYWGDTDGDLSEGTIRLQGGNLAARAVADADKITPDDFRLRPDSAGYKAGKDKKDLGADVDMVGPGKAYERWKKTPEYQQWLKETVQLKAKTEPTTEPGAFVLLGGMGAEVGKFDTLTEAVKTAASGDTIEIRGNGPFVTDLIDFGPRALTTCAGSGYAPSIIPSPAAVKNADCLLSFHDSLTLEGLELHHCGVPEKPSVGMFGRGLLGGHGASLSMTNCKLVVIPGKPIHSHTACCIGPARVQLRNCLIVCPEAAYGVGVWSTPGTAWTVNNCLIAAPNALLLSPDENNSPGTMVRVTRSHLIGAQHAWVVQGPSEALAKRLRDKAGPPVVRGIVEMEGNIIQCWRPFCLNSATATPGGLPVEEQRRFLPQMIRLQERGNVLNPSDAFLLNLHAPPTGLLKGLDEWNAFWGLKDTGSMLGTVRMRGNVMEILAKAPGNLTPDDFRLRPDSAGYQAGKDKKDLGADVDLVGPGAAYERWKKTPEYQQWLKDTGQLKAVTEPTKEPRAFVLLGGKGVEVGKYDTLTEAVKTAASGDTIEIRGNGPFFTDPLDLGAKALTIRAGSGYAPVITTSPVAAKASFALLSTRAALTLEGLELRYEARPDEVNRCLIHSSAAPLSITNCKLVLPRGNDPQPMAINPWASPSGRIRNCMIASPGYTLILGSTPNMKWAVDNCLIVSAGAPSVYIQPDEENSPGTHLRLTRNTLAGDGVLTVGGPTAALAERLRDRAAKPVVPAVVEVEDNVSQVRRVVYLNSASEKAPQGLPQEEQRRIISKLIRWRERGNVYDAGDEYFLGFPQGPAGLIKDISEWNTFWGLKDTGSVQGTVLLRGNPKALLAENLEKITPDDFRLRPASAGYQAGKDKKDLGADVDLVGPGPAFERWKKTPEYQQWLKDTGQGK